jgi:hypothetical protein
MIKEMVEAFVDAKMERADTTPSSDRNPTTSQNWTTGLRDHFAGF